jgi:hypothetical protein
MALAARSFTDPEGLQNSALPRRETPGVSAESLGSSMRGVFPTRSKRFMASLKKGFV